MEKALLRYKDLSVDNIREFHRSTGGVLVELSKNQGKVLHALLDRRDRVERSLLTDAGFLSLLRDMASWSAVELWARLFYRRLLLLQSYVSSVDAAHGWETAEDGREMFVLLPVVKEQGG